MSRRRKCIALLAIGACAVVSPGASVEAYTAEVTPGAGCGARMGDALEALERSLTPANGATVQEGAPVTFSGESIAPLTFAVASSQESLDSPDIDSGPGTAEAGSSTYAFTSTKATDAPRTVYWSASFSAASFPECGESPKAYTTAPRALTVLPNTAKEHQAAEAKEREAHERQAAERRSAEQTATSTRCVVPVLKNDSLVKARHALARAHCRLGSVAKPRGHKHGRLLVAREIPRPGSRLASGARVRIVLRWA